MKKTQALPRCFPMLATQEVAELRGFLIEAGLGSFESPAGLTLKATPEDRADATLCRAIRKVLAALSTM